MTSADQLLGSAPRLRRHLAQDQQQQDLMAAALCGDLAWALSPASVSTPATSAASQREVTVALSDSAGRVHTWAQGALGSLASLATSGGGAAWVSPATITLADGEASLSLSLASATWASGDTVTLTVSAATIAGYLCPAADQVQTYTD